MGHSIHPFDQRIGLEPFPDFSGKFASLRGYFQLVDFHKFSVLHQHFTARDRGHDTSTRRPEQKVPVDVDIGKRGRRRIVGNNDVGGISFGKAPHRSLKITSRYRQIIFEEHRWDLAPGDIGMSGSVFLKGVRHFVGLEHVADVPVGTQPDKKTALTQPVGRGFFE